jgi:dihydrofolate synthase/folylpolyglutamate synthase
MSYAALLERLFTARGGGVRLQLGRIERCLAVLGDPQLRFEVRVHVGGTNGKGSTAAFVESMVRAAGKRTGLFTSPHLSRFNERFVVAGQPLSDGCLLAAGRALEAAVDELPSAAMPTFFEQATAMALWAFAEQEVEVAILEVGLGGRFDATNVVDAEVAAVTGVALDHQCYLGDTLAEIAGEKAGIFKPGQRVVIGAAGESEAVALLEAAAVSAGADRVTTVGSADIATVAGWNLGLAGPHQRANAACALAVVDQLASLGVVDVPGVVRQRALAGAVFPGRMETLPTPAGPRVIVDGAHNPHAARTLAIAIAEVNHQRRIVVLGVSADKDVAGVAAPLIAGADVVVVTQSRQERARPASQVAEVVRELGGAPVCIGVASEAFEYALNQGDSADLLVIAGSLFLVGEARELLCGVETDPIQLSDPVSWAS